MNKMANAQLGALLTQAIQIHRSGDVSGAERLYRDILAADRGTADAWHMLAIVLFDQNRLEESAQAVERATALRPKIPAYWVTRGNIEEERKQELAAQSAFRRAIRLSPGIAEAHYGLARSYHRDRKLKDAIAEYRSALRAAPELADIHYHLARALIEQNRLAEAFEEYREAFARDPECTLDRGECLDQFKHVVFDALPEFWHGEATSFFGREDIDKTHYATAGLRILMVRPEYRAVQFAAATQPQGKFEPDQKLLEQVMRNELFGILLRDAVLTIPEFERFLTRLREALVSEVDWRARAPLPFLCDLAMQCINNEYVYDEGPAEAEKIKELACEIGAVLRGERLFDEQFTRSLAVFAMYRPLHALEGIETLLERPAAAPGIGQLLRRSVGDLREERRLRTVIRPIGGIGDAVSQAVRRHYEENPYPRWHSFNRFAPAPALDWIRGNVPGLSTIEEVPAELRVLVAGCGTGIEAISLAAVIQGVRVTAVDLSLSSLAYAQRKANELRVPNVEFLHADILELGSLSDRFDFVQCMGVLHHMRAPEEGLRVLVRLLRPGGLVNIGLYSEKARAGINAVRDIVRVQSLAPSAAAIRKIRQDVLGSERDSVLRGVLRTRDFFSISECRDLLFHVQEHQYGLPNALEMLRSEGLTILGLSTQMLQRALPAYRKMFPGDETMTDPHRWDAVEAQHPQTFESMYRIWCRRPDSIGVDGPQ